MIVILRASLDIVIWILIVDFLAIVVASFLYP